MEKTTPKLFISYRRTVLNGEPSDTAVYAEKLYELLVERFGKEQMFLDTQSITDGSIWPAEIGSKLNDASVVVVLIGERWLFAQNKHGQRRLDSHDDWVRREIEIAIQSKPDGGIIPILQCANQLMPDQESLPESIKALSNIQASKLRLETLEKDFEDFARLLVQKHGFVPRNFSKKTRRVFISLPSDEWLTTAENETKWAIVSQIESLGYTAEMFLDPRGTSSLAGSLAWTAVECENVMSRCDGCVILGFPRWRLRQDGHDFWLPTDFNHYEGALANTLGIPLLVLVQDRVERRVVFDRSYKGFVGTIPNPPCRQWLSSEKFKVPFDYWRRKMEERRDVFLGYCSAADQTAKAIRHHLTTRLGVSVLDWATDFLPATTILQQIQEASRTCSAGIFLFTKDDLLLGGLHDERAAPRDNVVFEAGFFCSIKGKNRVLIILEQGAKLPADLGGDIYASLKKKDDIEEIEPVIQRFVSSL